MFSGTGFKGHILLIAALFSMASINLSYADGGASTNGEWEYSLAPLFLWAQGIEGTSALGPTEAPLDITFKDALSNLEGTFTIHFEMKRDALSFFAEYQYVNLGPEAVGPMGGTLDVDFKDSIGELGIAYWVFGTEKPTGKCSVVRDIQDRDLIYRSKMDHICSMLILTGGWVFSAPACRQRSRSTGLSSAAQIFV